MGFRPEMTHHLTFLIKINNNTHFCLFVEVICGMARGIVINLVMYNRIEHVVLKETGGLV